MRIKFDCHFAHKSFQPQAKLTTMYYSTKSQIIQQDYRFKSLNQISNLILPQISARKVSDSDHILNL